MVLIDRASVVAIHLDQLERSTAPEAPGVAEAVYASVALRFLMDDNALGRVAHDRGVSIKVEAPAFENIPVDQTLLFAAGGYPYDGRLTKAFYFYRGAGPTSPHRAQFERLLDESPETPPMVALKLAKFFASPCLGLHGEILSRERLVRYVANKCGGAHHHDNRDKFETIDEQLTDIGQAIQMRGDQLSAVFLETLGTAWLLLQSSGVSALRKALG